MIDSSNEKVIVGLRDGDARCEVGAGGLLEKDGVLQIKRNVVLRVSGVSPLFSRHKLPFADGLRPIEHQDDILEVFGQFRVAAVDIVL